MTRGANDLLNTAQSDLDRADWRANLLAMLFVLWVLTAYWVSV